MLIMSLESSITEYIDSSLNTIPDNTTIRESGLKMIELGVDGILVLENQTISGMITQKDIMKAISEGLDLSSTVNSIMSKPLITISSDANVGKAIKKMKENNIRRLIVKDDSDIKGIITQKKIFGYYSSKAIEIPELELPTKIKCPYCLSFFEKKEELSKHIDQVHVGYGVFQGNFSKVEDLGSISSPDSYPKSL